MQINFVTSNMSKVSLANERLSHYGVEVTQCKADFIEPQSLDVEEVAIKKSEQIMKTIKSPFIVEDSGLYIKSLNGFPGALMKPVLDSIGDERLLKLLRDDEDREVLVKSVLVYANPEKNEIKAFVGLYEGFLSKSIRGNESRGWKVSKIFIPRGTDKTLAELNEIEWTRFLDDFRKEDHYEKFGIWIRDNPPSVTDKNLP